MDDKKCYQKEPVMVVFWRGSARALQIQRLILAANHCIEGCVHNGGIGRQTGGVGGRGLHSHGKKDVVIQPDA